MIAVAVWQVSPCGAGCTTALMLKVPSGAASGVSTTKSTRFRSGLLFDHDAKSGAPLPPAFGGCAATANGPSPSGWETFIVIKP